MRGFRGEEGAKRFAEGFAVQYNFMKGHRSLGGKTPAQVAGIALGKNSWLEMISEAVNDQNGSRGSNRIEARPRIVKEAVI